MVLWELSISCHATKDVYVSCAVLILWNKTIVFQLNFPLCKKHRALYLAGWSVSKKGLFKGRPLTDHFPFVTDHIPTVFTDRLYRPHTDRLYRPRTDHIPTTFTDHVPTTYRTDQLVHYYPVLQTRTLWEELTRASSLQVFYYSTSIFETAGVKQSRVATALIGVVGLVMTAITVSPPPSLPSL